jgi:hypothetical protein
MHIQNHVLTATRLADSGDRLLAHGRYREAAWIYQVSATHWFNALLHALQITLAEEVYPTHHAGLYWVGPTASAAPICQVRAAADVIHADMPPIGALSAAADHIRSRLRQLEAVSMPAVHQRRPVSKHQAQKCQETLAQIAAACEARAASQKDAPV